MRRRSRAGSESAKLQRRKTGAGKSRNAPKTVRRRSSAAIEETELARVIRERDDALEQQTATSQVLQIISGSMFDLQTVLDTLVKTGVRLCQADQGAIWLLENNILKLAASCGQPSEFVRFSKDNPITPGRGTVSGRVILEGKIVHLADVLADPDFTGTGYQATGNYRTNLGVPLLRKGEAIGAFLVARRRARPFTEQLVKLLETFADQAVIAIENTRLFEAEQQRTRELTESLEQQTATADVLRVISSSPGDLEPVFQAILANATRICAAKFGNLWLREGNNFRIAATHGAPPAYVKYLKREPVVTPEPESAMAQIADRREAVQIEDISEAPTHGMSMRVATINLAKARSLVGVPMIKDDELIGIIAVYRQEVRSFNDKQVDLLKNFANQAVIAIENARLLNELRRRTTDLTERTTDLTEALERQTATSEVLQVISSSPAELEPVFQAMLENAVRVCQAKFGIMFLYDGEAFRAAALHGTSPAYAEARRRAALVVRDLHPDVPAARLARTKKLIHIADARLEQSYVERDPLVRRSECVPKSIGSRPMLAIHSERSRAYCRVVMQRPKPRRPVNRNSPGFSPVAFK
jgi:GAF domain-containing protein